MAVAIRNVMRLLAALIEEVKKVPLIDSRMKTFKKILQEVLDEVGKFQLAEVDMSQIVALEQRLFPFISILRHMQYNPEGSNLEKLQLTAQIRQEIGGYDAALGRLVGIIETLAFFKTNSNLPLLTSAKRKEKDSKLDAKRIATSVRWIFSRQSELPGETPQQKKIAQDARLFMQVNEQYFYQSAEFIQRMNAPLMSVAQATVDLYEKSVFEKNENSGSMWVGATNRNLIKSANAELVGYGYFGPVTRTEYNGKPVVIRPLPRKEKLTIAARAEIRSLLLKWRKDLHHENIVSLHGVLFEDHQWFQILESCESTFYEMIHHPTSDVDKLKMNKTLEFIARGLAFLHSQNVLHQNLKPDNILIMNRFPYVKLSSFGMSEIVKEVKKRYQSQPVYEKNLKFADTNSFRLEDQRSFLVYQPPEIFQDENAWSTFSDIYSLAVIMWEAVTRDYPFKNVKDEKLKHHVVDKDMRPDWQKKDINEQDLWFQILVENCWMKEPYRRYAADDVMQTLSIRNAVGEGGKLKEHLKRLGYDNLARDLDKLDMDMTPMNNGKGNVLQKTRNTLLSRLSRKRSRVRTEPRRNSVQVKDEAKEKASLLGKLTDAIEILFQRRAASDVNREIVEEKLLLLFDSSQTSPREVKEAIVGFKTNKSATENRKEFIALMMKFMENYPQDVQINKVALGLIRSLIDVKGDLSSFNGDSLQHILEVMKKFMDDYHVQLFGLMCLKSFSSSDSLILKIFKSDAQEVILESMTAFPEEESIQVYSMAMISNLQKIPSEASPADKKRFEAVTTSTNSFKAVFDALETFSDSRNAQLLGLGIILNWINMNAGSIAEMVQAGILESIAIVLRTNRQDVEVQKRALIVLKKLCKKNHAKVKSGMNSESILKELLCVAPKVKSDKVAYETAIFLLSTLAETMDNLKACLDIIRHNLENKDIVSSACRQIKLIADKRSFSVKIFEELHVINFLLLEVMPKWERESSIVFLCVWVMSSIFDRYEQSFIDEKVFVDMEIHSMVFPHKIKDIDTAIALKEQPVHRDFLKADGIKRICTVMKRYKFSIPMKEVCLRLLNQLTMFGKDSELDILKKGNITDRSCFGPTAIDMIVGSFATSKAAAYVSVMTRLLKIFSNLAKMQELGMKRDLLLQLVKAGDYDESVRNRLQSESMVPFKQRKALKALGDSTGEEAQQPTLENELRAGEVLEVLHAAIQFHANVPEVYELIMETLISFCYDEAERREILEHEIFYKAVENAFEQYGAYPQVISKAAILSSRLFCCDFCRLRHSDYFQDEAKEIRKAHPNVKLLFLWDDENVAGYSCPQKCAKDINRKLVNLMLTQLRKNAKNEPVRLALCIALKNMAFASSFVLDAMRQSIASQEVYRDLLGWCLTPNAQLFKGGRQSAGFQTMRRSMSLSRLSNKIKGTKSAKLKRVPARRDYDKFDDLDEDDLI